MEFSNKSLALLLIAAIVISLGGTLLSLDKLTKSGFTGLASGRVELSITSSAQCVVDTNVSYGAAAQPATNLTLSTQSDNTAGGYTNCLTNASCQGMLVNNTGNVNLVVNFTSNVDGVSFIGGPGVAADQFMYYAKNGTDAGAEMGCRNASLNNEWRAVATNISTICSNLTYVDTNDIMTIEFNVSITPQTPPTTKTALVTVSCTETA